MKRLLSCSAVLLLCAVAVMAQATTTLTGVVTDPTGAAVPGAAIVIENLGTNATRDTVSDAQGRYQFVQVTPGAYRIKAKAQGFSDVIVNDVRLLVNTPATVNVSFEKVGSVATTVEVSAEAVQVNTTDATLGNSFGTKPILQLPFEGRNIVGLLALQPGVSFTADANTATDRSGAVNGGRSDQANVTLDGVDVNDQQTRSAFTSALRVPLDSVQEFRVTTTNANADMGRSSGAQISLVTKSGTNDFHGSAYWYLRNKATNANSFLNNSAGVPLSKLNRNVYGASFGGPIKKNKLFFFGNWEGRQDRREDSVLRTVPTQSLRDGFLKYIDTGNNIVTLSPADIRARLDATGPNQAALDLFKRYPLPNSTEIGDGINSSGYRFNSPVRLRQNTYVAKIDFALNDRTNLFVRGNLQNDNDTSTLQFPGSQPRFTNLDNSKGLAVGVTSSLKPNFIVNARYGYTRQGVENSGANFSNQISFRTLDDVTPITRSFRRFSPTHHGAADFNYIMGSHNVAFGGSIRRYNNDRLNYANSFFGASGNASWLVGSGNLLNAPFTDMLPAFRVSFRDAAVMNLGLVTQVTSRYNYLPKPDGSVIPQPLGEGVPRNFAGEEYEWYLQDTWRATRHLTITAGLRWGIFPPVYEVNDVQTSPNIPLSQWFETRVNNADNGLPAQFGLPPVSYVLANKGGRPLYDTNFQVAPRFGIAYSPEGKSGLSKFLFGSEKTSIRAGWGMYYDLMGAGLIRAYDASALGLSTSLNNPSGRLDLTTVPRFTGLNNIPTSIVSPPPPAQFPVVQPNNFAITNSLDDKLTAPYTMNMNFSIGREFKDGLFVQFSYVGRQSRHTLTSEDLATPTNLKDPASGQTYYEAATQLALLDRANTPVASVGRIPFWENMWPGAANATNTATQRVYSTFRSAAPDYTYALELLDSFCSPSCSKYGPFVMYSPQYSYLRALRSVGMGYYNSFQMTVRKRFRNNDQIDFNYTWGKSMDFGSASENNAPDRNASTIITPYNRKQHLAVSDYDTTHIFNANWVYNIPVGRGQRFGGDMPAFADALVGGWQLTGLYRQTSGFPTLVGNGRFWPTNYNLTGYATQIAPVTTGTNKNAPRPTAGGQPGPNLFPDPSVAIKSFANTLPGQLGGRNNLRGDGIFTIDAGLGKWFRMPYAEGHTVQFRAEVFNLTNTVRFDPWNITMDLGNASAFGRYAGTLVSPRVMQFALRYEF